MKKKLIKRYQGGGPTRQYAYGPLPSKDKWNGITTIKDFSGRELSPGDLVMATPEGKMVTKDNTQAYLDYLAANDIPIEGPTLDQLTVTYNKNTGETKSKIGEDFEDRLERLQQDPIANDKQIKQLWLEQGEQLWNQSHDKHVIDTRAADKAANARTPEALSLMSPALLGIAAILGFESASAMAAWAAAYPEAFTGIVGSTLGGEIINLATNLGSGGKYRDWGDAANQIWGTGETLGEFTNPGYFWNPLARATSAIEQFGKAALDKTVSQLNGSWTNRALNAANKYNLGQGIKTGIYNLNQTLQYDPKVISKAALKHLQLGIQDTGWHLSNIMYPRRKKLTKSQSAGWPYIPDKFNLKAYKPSDRAEAQSLYNSLVSLRNYTLKKQVRPKFKFSVLTDEGPLNVQVETPISLSSSGTSTNPYIWTFDNPNIVKKLISLNPDRSIASNGRYKYPTLEDLDIIAKAIKEGKFDNEFSRTESYSPSFRLFLPGKLNFFESPEKHQLDPKIIEINNLLGDLGHVTGSSISVQNSYATHTPNDVDLITTSENMYKVLNLLDAELKNPYNPADGHIKIFSKKYNEVMDLQVIDAIDKNTSAGKIAQQLYAKYDPINYSRRIAEDKFDVPISAQELLNIHKNNVLNFVNMDQISVNSEKQKARVPNIYGSSNEEEVIQTIRNLETLYRAIVGKDFKTIEEQGIKIDYSDIENNTQFLIKIGVDPEDAAKLAKDPSKVELAVKNYIYETHIGARNIERQNKMTMTDVHNALHSNNSYDNFGGNHGRNKFGGGEMFGGNDGYLMAVQFPVKNPKNINKPLDVYNTIGQYSTASPVSYPEQAKQLASDFKLPIQIQEKLRKLLHIPEDRNIESLQDVINYTVPSRGYLDIHIGSKDLNTQDRQLLGDSNDTFADIMGLDFVFSNQEGFNGFQGRYRRDIPNLNYNIVHVGPQSFNQKFYGFEFPKVSPIVKSRGVIADLPLDAQTSEVSNKLSWVYRPTLNQKRLNAYNLIDEKHRQQVDLLYGPDELYAKLKLAAATSPIIGILGGAIFGSNNSPSARAHRFRNALPDTNTLIKLSSEELNKLLMSKQLYFDDNDLLELENAKNDPVLFEDVLYRTLQSYARHH